MAKKYGTVIDRDKGLNKILQQVKELSKNSQVAIGVRGNEAVTKKTTRTVDGKEVTMFDAPNLATVASWNEFGTEDGRIPERSSIRSTMDKNAYKYSKMMVLLAGRILDPKVMMTVEQALGIAGEKVVLDIKAAITAGIDPANAQSTIDAKGSSKPLVDTGQFINAISYDVRLNKQYAKSVRTS